MNERKENTKENQVAENSSVRSNRFENGQKVDQEIQLAEEEIEKEQEFKEAQTERD